MRLEHIALYVDDLEAARRFFMDYFDAQSNDGYSNPRTGLRTYFLTFEGGARLEIMNKPVLPDTGEQSLSFGLCPYCLQIGKPHGGGQPDSSLCRRWV